eukprot:17976-Prorocentrum_minimum.AAC.4
MNVARRTSKGRTAETNGGCHSAAAAGVGNARYHRGVRLRGVCRHGHRVQARGRAAGPPPPAGRGVGPVQAGSDADGGGAEQLEAAAAASLPRRLPPPRPRERAGAHADVPGGRRRGGPSS